MIILLHFVAGLIASIYEMYDIKRSRPIDDIDYVMFFGIIILGYVSFVIMVFDIYQKERWSR